MKRLLKILRNITLTLIAIIILLMVLVNLSSVQTYMAQKATKILSEKLNTKVSLEHIRIDLLNHVSLEGLYIEDQQKDTLAYIGKAQIRITDWFFIKNGTPVLHYVGLNNAYIHLYRNSNSAEWNYTFIEKAFSNNTPKKKNNKQQNFEIDLEKILLDNIRFHMDDAWVGYDYDIDIGNFATNIDNIDFKKKIIAITDLKLAESEIRLRDFKGGKPPQPKKESVIDTTPFNPDNWSVKIGDINFDNCRFAFVAKEEKPYPNEFDPEYIDIKNISSTIKYFKIFGDTIKAQVRQFNANERSGFVVKQLQSDVRISPIASICSDLFIETNNSKISDYYAMHYKRFPDFLDYISKVKMIAHLKKSTVDPKDVAFFAPQLHDIPLFLMKISGDGQGTVDKLLIKNLEASDGFSSVKGELSINGLPDIDQSIFDFKDGEIVTTGISILKYAPSLKNNPNLNLNAIDYAYFNGSFKGLITDFAAKGHLKSNLGNISADIIMKLPKNQKPTYSGNLSSQAFNIGKLFNQPSLGATTFNAELQGASFDIDGIHIKAKSKFNDITFNGYTYRNIIAEGIFDKNKFDGNLIINDSNLALGFYGNIDFSQQDIKINATANLLKSDLQAIKLTNVPTTLTADFDLNCSGKTIDDFIGAAKLYNINLTRKAKRLDLDSINIKSYLTASEKHIDIESNLLSAKVNGRFLLSEIPNSTVYFLSKYLPSYIKSNGKIASDQEINFNVNTRQINDLISAFSNNISGFDSSQLVGQLNTINQTLSVNAYVPQGKIGTVKLLNASLQGNGNYNDLHLKSDVQSFIIGNNILNTTLSLNASIGNDSLNYIVSTKSDQQYGTATLSGKAYASNDSFYFKFLPSELFLNNTKWEIPDGNKIVYADKYLFIENLELSSGLQKLSINSDLTKINNPLTFRAFNIDIAQLASLTPAAIYQPDGRLNGELQIENLFTQTKFISKIEANGVKILGDTVGTVKLNGTYDIAQQLISLENTSGIFNNKFSVVTNGDVFIDPNSQEQINGEIQISNFPIKFIEPFLIGYASKLGGTIDGSINLKGTLKNPDFDGELLLRNILARVDYIGTLYTIPYGKINIKKQTATLDNIELFDVYKNKALALGSLQFDNIQNPHFNLQLKTDQFEVVNLRDYENELFYGHVIAKTNFTINGYLNNLVMNIKDVTPTQKSSIFLPYNSAGDISTNNYISFKSYGKTKESPIKKAKDKLSVEIYTTLNPLIDVTLVLDPTSGDLITANGNGNLNINVPANDDYSLFGKYNIDKGKYIFTFRQIFTREFQINSGSSISFLGNIANTGLNIHASYLTKTRLYDLLDQSEAGQIKGTKDEEDAKVSQSVNVLLKMTNTLASPAFDYEIDLPEKRSITNLAYGKLTRINQSDKTNLTNQVSALLLLGTFMPTQGITNTLAYSGVKTTMGETIASQASPLLTSALNKLIGDSKLSVSVVYKNYAQEVIDGTSTNAVDSRNVVKVGLGRNYFNDRLKIQIGSAYDWGKPTLTNQTTSNFNLAGDFKAQYLLRPDGGSSIVGFRSSNYDLFSGYNIATGVGISWRKSFDNLYEFFHSKKRIQLEQAEKSNGAKP